MTVVKNMLNDTQKISIGAVLVLLLGPAILAGMLVACVVHQTCTFVLDLSVWSYIARRKVAIWTVVGVIAAIIAAGGLYIKVIEPYGWLSGMLRIFGVLALVIAGVVALIGVIIGISLVFEKLNDWRKARKQQRIADGIPPSTNAIKKGARNSWDVARLIVEAARYSYKQICDLSPVPPEVIAAAAAAQAEHAAEAA
jgi:hypothetical protein